MVYSQATMFDPRPKEFDFCPVPGECLLNEIIGTRATVTHRTTPTQGTTQGNRKCAQSRDRSNQSLLQITRGAHEF
jgi:hypothetical protein